MHVSVALKNANEASKDGFQLEKVKEKVTVGKPIVISPFETVEIEGENKD